MASTEGKADLKELFLALDEDESGSVTAPVWAGGIIDDANREILHELRHNHLGY